MRVNTNVNALVAMRNLAGTNAASSESMAKLSTGFRINKASDDAAGLGIANKLKAETKALAQASRNAEQANSILQIAEGGVSTVQKMLERMKELATQAASNNTDGDGRARIHKEFSQLREEITRTVETTKFGSSHLLKGGFGSTTTPVTVDGASDIVAGSDGVSKITMSSGAAAGTYSLTVAAGKATLTNADSSLTQTVDLDDSTAQTLDFSAFGVKIETNDSVTGAGLTGKNLVLDGGTTTASGGSFLVSSSGSYGTHDQITLSAMDLRVTADGTGSGLELDGLDLSADPAAANGARAALDKLDESIATVNTVLGDIGASQNRIQYAQDNLKAQIVNFSAAESVIRDLDMADEMTKFSKNNIISQAATAMLAQANQSSQGVLQLLRG